MFSTSVIYRASAESWLNENCFSSAFWKTEEETWVTWIHFKHFKFVYLQKWCRFFKGFNINIISFNWNWSFLPLFCGYILVQLNSFFLYSTQLKKVCTSRKTWLMMQSASRERFNFIANSTHHKDSYPRVLSRGEMKRYENLWMAP